MLEFTVLHRGVPIGAARCTEAREEPFAFSFLDFMPTEAFDSVRPIVERASQAVANFGFLGPAADPASDVAGQEAMAAARRLCSELEVADAAGRRLPGRVTWIEETVRFDGSTYRLDLEVDAAEAGLPARVPSPPIRQPGHQPPAA